MRISQKRNYILNTDIPADKNTNLDIMEKIREFRGPPGGLKFILCVAEFLSVSKVTEIKRDRENYTELAYEVKTLKKESCDRLINYLTIYPLFSSKHQDFLD